MPVNSWASDPPRSSGLSLRASHNSIRMKNTFILFLLAGLFWLPSQGFAQYSSIDSLNYELQRQKVNALLDQRETRFGQFETSLRTRTGIFGLKTKRDMQTSIDILQAIIEVDNEVFRETKKLLDIKDHLLDSKEFEKERIQELAQDYDERINGYIQTISKLQIEQDKLQAELNTLRGQNNLYLGWLSLMGIIALAGLGTWMWNRHKKSNLTKK